MIKAIIIIMLSATFVIGIFLLSVVWAWMMISSHSNLIDQLGILD